MNHEVALGHLAADLRIDQLHAGQRLPKRDLEVTLIRVACAELNLQSFPRDQGRMAGRQPVRPKGQPGIEVERHRALLQRSDCTEIQRDGRSHHPMEDALTQSNARWQPALAVGADACGRRCERADFQPV